MKAGCSALLPRLTSVLPLILAAPLILAPLMQSSTANAQSVDKPRGTYIPVDPSTVELWDPSGGPMDNGKVYLNRCANGCTVTPGSNSSLSDRSSIIGGTRQLSAWEHGDETWNEFVGCVQGIFEPFGVVVTDVEPSGAHHEVMIAGTPQQLGMGNGILGVSPATCGIINNSLTFVFANVSSSVPDLCWAAAQEPAHSWGLDHQMLCEDPMTYLTAPCGTSKYAFQNTNAPCGEDQNRSCRCGGSTQNSYNRVAQIFGVDGGDPPEMAIIRPTPDQKVRPNFPIEVQVTDVSPIGPVEIYVNGTLHAMSEFAPYIFNAPESIADGPLTIEVRATDIHGAEGVATVNVEVDTTAPDPNNPDPGNPNPGGDEGGGCQTASTGTGASALAIALFGLVFGRIRRKRRC